MRLDGSLEDFGLPDVLQLLAQTQKTGALHLQATDSARRGLIRLGGGSVDGACSDLRRQALARRLVGAGIVSDDALTGAVDDVRAGAASLVRALIERSGLAPDEVKPVAADHATDAVCELLRWTSGTFSFMVGEVDPDQLELALRAEELVAEGQRRMQVWPTLTSHIPSPDSVLRLAAAPSFDPSCTREEWALLALVDGSRSVSEIVALLGRSEFAVAGALAALVERGLLTVSADGSGLADLQRRQAIVAALETDGGMVSPAPSSLQESPAAASASTAAASTAPPAAEVPQAREASSVAPPDVPASAPAPTPDPAPATSRARIFDQPLTHGNTALDPAPHADPEAAVAPRTAPDTAARGIDSAVTKSLVLRLIAGVRGL